MQGSEQPKANEERTWHVHEDGTWEWEATCLACMADVPQMGDLPMFNITRLKADNAGHYTQYGMMKEIDDEARRQGRDIQRG